MQILQAPLENYILSEYTTFAADEEVGQTILSVTDPTGFSANKYVVLGVIGNENSEICQVASTSTNSITVAVATTKKHYKDEPIQVIRYNQRKFYRSSTENGTFTHLTSEGSPVTIKVDNTQETILEDTTGTSTSWYKATYFNSTTAGETSLDDAIAVQAGDGNHFTSIYKILKESGFENNSYISSDTVSRYRDEAEEEIESILVSIYSLPLPSSSKLLQHISTLLSSGFLLSSEYGLENDINVSKSGQGKIDRAEKLLKSLVDKSLTLIENGNLLSSTNTMKVSCSNKFNNSIYDKGEIFTLRDEPFKMADPTDGIGSTDRNDTDFDGFK